MDNESSSPQTSAPTQQLTPNQPTLPAAPASLPETATQQAPVVPRVNLPATPTQPIPAVPVTQKATINPLIAKELEAMSAAAPPVESPQPVVGDIVVTTNAPLQTKPKSRSKLFLIIGLAAVVVIGLAVGYVLVSKHHKSSSLAGSSSSKGANTKFVAISGAAKNIDNSYSLYQSYSGLKGATATLTLTDGSGSKVRQDVHGLSVRVLAVLGKGNFIVEEVSAPGSLLSSGLKELLYTPKGFVDITGSTTHLPLAQPIFTLSETSVVYENCKDRHALDAGSRGCKYYRYDISSQKEEELSYSSLDDYVIDLSAVSLDKKSLLFVGLKKDDYNSYISSSFAQYSQAQTKGSAPTAPKQPNVYIVGIDIALGKVNKTQSIALGSSWSTRFWLSPSEKYMIADTPNTQLGITYADLATGKEGVIPSLKANTRPDAAFTGRTTTLDPMFSPDGEKLLFIDEVPTSCLYYINLSEQKSHEIQCESGKVEPSGLLDVSYKSVNWIDNSKITYSLNNKNQIFNYSYEVGKSPTALKSDYGALLGQADGTR